ncbi:myb-like protein X [Carya illinoinensis]|uniref:myb-like protein X n=1 Tax=Carya illinoinensis TaxID=32201 RepID=UPI001C7225FE|nr:myb-like protein X [Carya illinoinensis]XP_042966707.1 myb-like protein X [Carya illinoinensis]XP_042966708.1 myb-like protein X [Carya illinoinensis]
MSRCFPFPPPGFEKKARTKDVDLLKQEKQREKKHKKEKRDKEKREPKEKRETDKNEAKPREKKDKKDKHRDKKKDKQDRDKDKEKKSTPDEKRLPGQTGEKLVKKDENKIKNHISDEKRFSGQFAGYNAKKLSESSHMAEEKDSKFVQELGRRIKDDDRATESKLVEKFAKMDQRKDEGTAKLVAEGKEKNKRVDDRKVVGQGIKGEGRFSGNSMVPSPDVVLQTRIGGISRPFEKNVERTVEEKERTKEKEGDDKWGDKRKDKDREKKSQGKDKDRDKEKKKEEKTKGKIDHKITEHDNLKDVNKSDLISSHDTKTLQLPKDSKKSAASEKNLKKRKEVDTNGVLHVGDLRPHKLARTTSSSHQFSENGRILEPCQTSVLNASDRHGAASNPKADDKECKINGVIDQSSSDSKKSTIVTAQADQIAQVSAKPPHPDSKYLSEVYMVPKMGEWSDYDDQEWLFSSHDFQSEKSKVESLGVEDTPQVWDEALRIESADVCALPYVIPY